MVGAPDQAGERVFGKPTNTPAETAAGTRVGTAPPKPDTDEIFRKIAAATMELESAFHPAPFACILGPELFVAVQTPTEGSMVLPADRIGGLLIGPTALTANGLLLRSGVLPPRVGVVVSLADPTMDIVVATPPKVQFLQVTEEAKYLFRVYERFVLRVKDPANPGVQAFTA